MGFHGFRLLVAKTEERGQFLPLIIMDLPLTAWRREASIKQLNQTIPVNLAAIVGDCSSVLVATIGLASRRQRITNDTSSSS